MGSKCKTMIASPKFTEGEDSMTRKPANPHEAAKIDALPLAGRRFVVADDEPDQLIYLTTVFEDHGATVATATNMRSTTWSWSLAAPPMMIYLTS